MQIESQMNQRQQDEYDKMFCIMCNRANPLVREKVSDWLVVTKMVKAAANGGALRFEIRWYDTEDCFLVEIVYRDGSIPDFQEDLEIPQS